MTFNESLKEIRKNWVVANIGLILGILGFTIWIYVMFSPIAQHTTITNDLRMQLLNIGFFFTLGGGIILALGFYIFGDEPF
jgi:uncharacterized membrane-anchored protein